MTAPTNTHCPRCGLGIHWDERAVVVDNRRWHDHCAPRDPAA